MIPRILGALLLCLACAAQAGVYTYIDAEGNRVYTDQPPSGRKAQRVELAPGNSVAPVPSQPFHLHRVSIAGQPLPEVDTPLVSAVQPSER